MLAIHHTVQFVAVVQAILLAARQLQQLVIEDVHSSLLRNLIQTAASSSLISCSAKLLATLNKEAADKGDLLNLILVDDDQFSEVCCSLAGINLHFFMHVSEVPFDVTYIIKKCSFRLPKRGQKFK